MKEGKKERRDEEDDDDDGDGDYNTDRFTSQAGKKKKTNKKEMSFWNLRRQCFIC